MYHTDNETLKQSSSESFTMFLWTLQNSPLRNCSVSSILCSSLFTSHFVANVCVCVFFYTLNGFFFCLKKENVLFYYFISRSLSRAAYAAHFQISLYGMDKRDMIRKRIRFCCIFETLGHFFLRSLYEFLLFQTNGNHNSILQWPFVWRQIFAFFLHLIVIEHIHLSERK